MCQGEIHLKRGNSKSKIKQIISNYMVLTFLMAFRIGSVHQLTISYILLASTCQREPQMPLESASSLKML